MQLVPLSQGFGAEIVGFDLAHGRDPGEVERLREAYDTHHLLIFRGSGPLAPERQAEIAGWFGPVGANRGPDGNPWTLLDNTNLSGSAVLPFHSDVTFLPRTLEGISLHPVALPSGGTTTSFISAALAWDALPAELKSLLQGRKVRHYYDSAGEMGLDWPVLEQWHPARMEHPRTGRPLLFVTQNHTDRIEGLDEDDSAEVIAALFGILYAPERRYDHRWRAGDLLVWDNLAIQHARPAPATPEQGSRIMRRVALGTINVGEELERARRAAA
jgi:taurine dioxygenase